MEVFFRASSRNVGSIQYSNKQIFCNDVVKGYFFAILLSARINVKPYTGKVTNTGC